MKPRRMLYGISILMASVWLVPMIADSVGDTVLGIVPLSGAIAFLGGAVFMSGFGRS